MEVKLSQKQQQQVQFYYNSTGGSCYSHCNFPSLKLGGEVEQQLFQEEISPVSVSTAATTTSMKSDEGVPGAYTPAYWSWQEFAPLDPDSLDLITNTASADGFFDDVPQSISAGDYMAEACAADDFSLSPPPPLPSLSAFTPYDGRSAAAASFAPLRNLSSRNAHARMLEFLRQLNAEVQEEGAAAAVAEDSGGSGSLGRSGGTSRCFRHMMRERQRRERLSQSYADLYSLVSGRSKADKNSIVQASAAYLKELSTRAERLRRRNQELRARDAAAAVAQRGSNPMSSTTSSDAAQIRLRVGNPCSSVDSVMVALRRLKGMGVQARSIRASVTGQDLNAVIDVDTNMPTAEVESALQGAIVEAEKKLQRGSGPNGGGGGEFRVGGTVSLNVGGGGSIMTMGGPSSLVPDSYSFGSATPFLPASAPSHQQLLPRSIVGWPSSYNSTNSGTHVAFRHIS